MLSSLHGGRISQSISGLVKANTFIKCSVKEVKINRSLTVNRIQLLKPMIGIFTGSDVECKLWKEVIAEHIFSEFPAGSRNFDSRYLFIFCLYFLCCACINIFIHNGSEQKIAQRPPVECTHSYSYLMFTLKILIKFLINFPIAQMYIFINLLK